MLKHQTAVYLTAVFWSLQWFFYQGVSGMALEGGTCPPDYFMCLDGTDCIESSKRCDDNPDCADKTDEYNCTVEGGEVAPVECGSGAFRCPGTDKCVPEDKRCDHFKDCDDGSDEHDCKASCEAPENFLCHDGFCVKATLLCNGHNDCSDASDESNCTAETPLADLNACMEYEYRCPDGTCMSKFRVCDGKADCNDGSDEILGCSLMQTTTEEQRQEHSETTLPPPLPPSQPVYRPENRTVPCSDNEFRCLDGNCIAENKICDKNVDCPDGSDEIHGCTGKLSCWDGFLCNNGLCVPKEWRCDENNDCGDGSDEKFCGGITKRSARNLTYEEERIKNLAQERHNFMQIHFLQVHLIEMQQSLVEKQLEAAKKAAEVMEAISEENMITAQLNRQLAEDKLRNQSELHWLSLKLQENSVSPTVPSSTQTNPETSAEANPEDSANANPEVNPQTTPKGNSDSITTQQP